MRSRTFQRRPAAILLSALWLMAAAPWVGLTLEQALLRLQEAGLPVIFTDELVRPRMRVGREPAAADPRRVLDELLAPHGLAARESVGGRIVVVRAPRPAAHEATAQRPPEAVEMVVTERIDVTSHPPWILGEEVSAIELGRDEALSLPRLGDDVLRGLTLLPGTAGDDGSARFNLRGGRADEVMVRLDGLEILEPFHLRDFNQALSVVSPATLGEVRLQSGGFAAEHGGRMSGILDLTSLEPSWRRRGELGLTLLNAQAAGSGTFHEERGRWLASLRGGSLELPFELAGEEENPRFWDAFGKVDRQLGAGHDLRLNALLSRDTLDFAELDDDRRFDTLYDGTYAWLTHETVLTPRLFVASRASFSRFERDRHGREAAAGGGFELADARSLDAAGLAQSWSRSLGGGALKWGFDARALDAHYDYGAAWDLGEALAAVRHQGPAGSFGFHERFRGEQYGLYAAGRLAAGRWTVEPGARFDANSIVDDDERVSPRLNVAWAPGERSRLRLAWGYFYQSPRLYELQVEDGVTEFGRPERAEHRILGFDHVFGRRLTLRAELYERLVRDPRVRFENLYEPLSIVPELEPDRVRVAPESSRARGVELLLGAAGKNVDWFVSYSFSRIEDRIAGHDVPRSVDQPHALGLELTWRAPWRWLVSIGWHYHSGWPTTALTAQLEGGGEVVPMLGPLYGERLPDHRRLDLRASRGFHLRRGELELFVEVQNLASDSNVRGYDVELEARVDGTVDVGRDAKSWGRLLPNVGLTWRF